MAILFCSTGPTQGALHEVTDYTVLGRVGSCDIKVNDGQASREHAAVVPSDGQWFVTDLGSRNGTLHNDEEVQNERRLRSGDRIAIGDTTYVFFEGDRAPLPGENLGPFEIIEPIRRKGEGFIYKARQKKLDRIVALLVLSSEYSEDPDYVKEFQRTARATGDLSHPSVLQLYDIGKENGFRYAVQEFFDGLTLRERLERGERFPPERTIPLLTQLAEALAAIHKRDMIHGNLTPESILVSDDSRVKLTDVRKARLAGKLAADDEDALFLARYVSPEEARYIELTPASDIYSLGCVAFHLLTGRTPIDGTNVGSVLRRHAREKAEPLRGVVEDAPEGLCFLVDRMLAKSSAERPQSATEVIELLESAHKSGAPSARASRASSSGANKAGRRPSDRVRRPSAEKRASGEQRRASGEQRRASGEQRVRRSADAAPAAAPVAAPAAVAALPAPAPAPAIEPDADPDEATAGVFGSFLDVIVLIVVMGLVFAIASEAARLVLRLSAGDGS